MKLIFHLLPEAVFRSLAASNEIAFTGAFHCTLSAIRPYESIKMMPHASHCLFNGEHVMFVREHVMFVREHFVFVREHVMFVREHVLIV